MPRIFTKNNESGFTLVEMIVVILILGILMAIAVPVYLNQRKEAWKAAVRTDITNSVMVTERAKSLSGDYAPSASAPTGVKLSAGVSLKVVVLPAVSGNTACIQAYSTYSAADTMFHYNIAERKMLSGGC